jgi:hypothetical protein
MVVSQIRIEAQADSAFFTASHFHACNWHQSGSNKGARSGKRRSVKLDVGRISDSG